MNGVEIIFNIELWQENKKRFFRVPVSFEKNITLSRIRARAFLRIA